MANPEGYKIYWGLTKDSVSGVYPDRAKAAYDSPFIVPATSLTITGETASYPLPPDFWHDSFSEIYFRVAAYLGTQEGAKSKVVGIYKFIKTFPTGGLHPFSLPLNDGNSYLAKNLTGDVSALKATIVFVYDKAKGKFVASLPTTPDLSSSALKAQTGMYVNIRAQDSEASGSGLGQREWLGRVWSD